MKKFEFWEYWKRKAGELKVETLALYYAARHPRLPWYARAWVLLVAAYAFSPIDLIPDFIPVLGYLDDLVIVPLGVFVALKLIPPAVMDECRLLARERLADGEPQARFMTVVVIVVWVLLAVAGSALLYMAMRRMWSNPNNLSENSPGTSHPIDL
jgi:uncharacterized membrane protein YkvA (DUF1232 family)